MMKTLDTIKYAALAILKKVAVKVLKFRLLGKGETPWVYYEDKQGKRRATFLKKSAFQGYDWNDDYSEVTNLETGEVYQVSADSCTCKDWHYRVRTGLKAQCKHQIMRSEYVEFEPSQNFNDFEINDEDLPPGCFTRKHETKNNIEYRLFAWVRKFNGEEYYPETEEIGSIIKTKFSGVEAWLKKVRNAPPLSTLNSIQGGSGAINGVPFDAVDDAINYLLRKIDLEITAQVYQYAESIL